MPRAKTKHNLYPGMLQPPVPTQIWEDVTVDSIEGLPSSHGKDLILVIVDRFTKYGHFLSLTHPISTT